MSMKQSNNLIKKDFSGNVRFTEVTFKNIEMHSPFSNAFEWMTVEEERAEWRQAVHQYPRLKSEKPQSDFKGGWIRMWTILSPFYDKNGYNRQFSTFSLEGLIEIGIIKGDL